MIWPRVVDRRTLAVSITHVSWQTGFRHSLSTVADIAHANGAYLIVDAAQSAGALDVDVHRVGVDFMTGLGDEVASSGQPRSGLPFRRPRTPGAVHTTPGRICGAGAALRARISAGLQAWSAAPRIGL